MRKNYTDNDKQIFAQNCKAVTSALDSIKENFFARTYSYLPEIGGSDNSADSERTHDFVGRLISEISDSITKQQAEMYRHFLYCTFLCMQRNLLPSFENVVALARNTEKYGQREAPLPDAELAKDKFIPRFGLCGMIRRIGMILEDKEIPEEEYTRSDSGYYDFCKRFDYGTYCHTADKKIRLHEDDSDEIFEKNRDEWDNAISVNIPDYYEFMESAKRFEDLFFADRSLFKATDIEKMIDTFLFIEGKSVFSTTSSRLNKLMGDLRNLDSNVFDERDLLEIAESVDDPLDFLNNDTLSIFNTLKEQDKWISDSTRYIRNMLSGMNINFIELITGATPEDTDKRIRRLGEMIEKSLTDNTMSVSDEECEMLRCFLYCVMWESLAIRGNASCSNVKCETFGDLLSRADLAVNYRRYSNKSLTRSLLGGVTYTMNSSRQPDDEMHFEHDDDDSNPEFDSVLFSKTEYRAKAERLRELIRAAGGKNDVQVFSSEFNMHLQNFDSLIDNAIKSFLYTSGLTAFSFGNDFEHISDDIRQAIHRIESVSNRMRFDAIKRTYNSISNPDSE